MIFGVWCLVFGVCGLPAASLTVNPSYTVTDFGLNTNSIRRVTLTPIAPAGDYTNAILVRRPLTPETYTNGVATFTNIVSGYAYQLTIESTFAPTRRTNFFPSTLSGDINGGDYLAWIAGFAADGSVLQWAWLNPTNLSTGLSLTNGNLYNATNRGVITLNGQAINSWDDVTNYFAQTGGGSGVFTAAGTNTTAQTNGNVVTINADVSVADLAAKAGTNQNPVLNPIMFGAAGNGTTDDTLSWSNAIRALNAGSGLVLDGLGKKYRLTAGLPIIEAQLATIQNAVILYDSTNGVVFMKTNWNYGGVLPLSPLAQAQSQFTLQNMGIYQTHGVPYTNNVAVCLGNGIESDQAGSYGVNYTVRNCIITNFWQGVFINSAVQAEITHNTINNSWSNAVFAMGGIDMLRIAYNEMDNRRDYNPLMNTNAIALYVKPWQAVSVEVIGNNGGGFKQIGVMHDVQRLHWRANQWEAFYTGYTNMTKLELWNTIVFMEGDGMPGGFGSSNYLATVGLYSFGSQRLNFDKSFFYGQNASFSFDVFGTNAADSDFIFPKCTSASMTVRRHAAWGDAGTLHTFEQNGSFPASYINTNVYIISPVGDIVFRTGGTEWGRVNRIGGAATISQGTTFSGNVNLNGLVNMFNTTANRVLMVQAGKYATNVSTTGPILGTGEAAAASDVAGLWSGSGTFLTRFGTNASAGSGDAVLAADNIFTGTSNRFTGSVYINSLFTPTFYATNVNVQNLIATNVFPQITNAALVGTDANGKLVSVTNAVLRGQPSLPDFATIVGASGALLGVDSSGDIVVSAAMGWSGNTFTGSNNFFGYFTGNGNGLTNIPVQMSITEDASGLKLSGDEASPGNSQYYGTDGSGTKGFHALPAGGSSTNFIRTLIEMGCDPTGSVDATPIILAAFTTNKILYAPPGTYSIQNLYLTNTLGKLFGAGYSTKFVLREPTTGAFGILCSNQFQLADFWIAGNTNYNFWTTGLGPQTTGLVYRVGLNGEISRILISDFRVGMTLVGNNNILARTNNTLVFGNIVTNCWAAIHAEGGNGAEYLLVKENRVWNSNIGFYNQTAANIDWDGMIHEVDFGIYISPNTSGSNPYRGHSHYRGTVNHVNSRYVYAENAVNSRFTGMSFMGATGIAGFTLAGCTNFIFQGCEIEANTTAIAFTGGNGNRFINNTFMNAQTNVTGATPHIFIPVDNYLNGVGRLYENRAQSLTADDATVELYGYRPRVTISSDNATPANRTFVLTGLAGSIYQRAVLVWSGTNGGQLIDDSANSGSGNVRLTANWEPTTANATLTLEWNGTDWVEVSRAAP